MFEDGRPSRRHPLRWLALSGVVGPVASVAAFTVAGALRPGYSPIHTSISALGVGPGGRLLNDLGIAVGVLFLVFTAVFVLELRTHIGPVRLGHRRVSRARRPGVRRRGRVQRSFDRAAAHGRLDGEYGHHAHRVHTGRALAPPRPRVAPVRHVLVGGRRGRTRPGGWRLCAADAAVAHAIAPTRWPDGTSRLRLARRLVRGIRMAAVPRIAGTHDSVLDV